MVTPKFDVETTTPAIQGPYPFSTPMSTRTEGVDTGSCFKIFVPQIQTLLVRHKFTASTGNNTTTNTTTTKIQYSQACSCILVRRNLHDIQ